MKEVEKQVAVWKEEAEKSIQALDITEDEKELVRNYYMTNNCWDYAYSESSLHQNLSEKVCGSDFDEKHLAAMKKYIYRHIDKV